MPEWVVEPADVRCGHDGRVANVASRRWITIDAEPVLVELDPQGRTVSRCPNRGPTIKPCTTTLVIRSGHSTFVRVDGDRAVLSTLTGLTDGTPPGTVVYDVREPGQQFVRVDR